MEKENQTPQAVEPQETGMEWLSDEQLEAIKAKVAELRKSKNIKRIYPIAVQGDEYDEKECYIAYFKQPNLMEFSKYLSISSKNDPTVAMRQLAKDCFVDGDRELVDDDSLFIYGAMPFLSGILNTRRGSLVNFSKSGK